MDHTGVEIMRKFVSDRAVYVPNIESGRFLDTSITLIGRRKSLEHMTCGGAVVRVFSPINGPHLPPRRAYKPHGKLSQKLLSLYTDPVIT